MFEVGPRCGFCSDHCAAAQASTSEAPAERLSSAARWAHPFVCYLNPGFGEIQSWLNNKSIWEDKEHLGNGFSLPVWHGRFIPPFLWAQNAFVIFSLGLDPDGRKRNKSGRKGNRKENKNRRLLARILLKKLKFRETCTGSGSCCLLNLTARLKIKLNPDFLNTDFLF